MTRHSQMPVPYPLTLIDQNLFRFLCSPHVFDPKLQFRKDYSTEHLLKACPENS